MRTYRLVTAGIGVVLAAGSLFIVAEAQRGTAAQRAAAATAAAQRGAASEQQQQPEPPSTVPAVPSPRMPLAPTPNRGASVTPAMEGWFKNADGTFTILIGYQNRNQTQTFDIPIGPNNSIEPGGPDYGQPTRFELARNHGVFTITVPRDFGTKRLNYTISVNGAPQTILLGLPGGYQVDPYFRADTGNTPPVAKLDATGPEFKGPPIGFAKTLTARVGEPLPLTVYATDKGNTVNQLDQFGAAAEPAAPAASATTARGAAARGRGGAAPITLRWYKHRGPAGESVKFDPVAPMVAADAEAAKLFAKPGDYTGKATTTATFAEPGEYVLRAQLNDATGNGGGGDQCCWSNIHIKVNVQAAAAK